MQRNMEMRGWRVYYKCRGSSIFPLITDKDGGGFVSASVPLEVCHVIAFPPPNNPFSGGLFPLHCYILTVRPAF